MNEVLGHLCAHLGKTGTEESPEDDEMTLPSGHRTRNSYPGGLRPSTLPLGHSGSLEDQSGDFLLIKISAYVTRYAPFELFYQNQLF